jgi:putative spermidine/putrescine transport system substrate-binding protein
VVLRRTHLVAAVSSAGLLAAACGATGQDGTATARPSPAAATSAVQKAVPGAGSGTGAGTGASASPTPSPAPSSSGPEPSPAASLGPGEGAVSVAALNGYAEWGGTDPKVKWIGTFEQQTGCKVSLRYYDPAAPEKPDDFSPSSFDVVSATPQLAGRLMADGKVAPLNPALIDDYDKISKRLRELPSVTQDDQPYGVPFLWGVNEVLYDGAKVRPDGPQAIFKDDGPVLFKDSPLSLADAALVLKERGADIKDPFDLTTAQLDRAAGLFSGGRQSTADRPRFWREPIDVVQGFASGSVRLAQGTPYHADVLKRGRTAVRAMTQRPVTGWADAWMVSSRAAHLTCAYKWLEYTASADVQRKAAMWNGLAPANPDACASRARAVRRVCAAYKVGDSRAFTGVYFAVRPPDYDQWIDRWSRVTG